MGWTVRVVCALALVMVSVPDARPQDQTAASPTPRPDLPPATLSGAPDPGGVPAASPSPAAVASPAAPAPKAALPAAMTADQIRSRERLALVSLSTVMMAQRTYAAMNGSLFDSITCLMQPGVCLPGQKDAAPLIDPGYHWLEPRLGYVMRFHPGPGATPDEIRRSGASPSSIKGFAVTLTPEHPGLTGGRAFCGDSSGKMCFTDGVAPPVKDGRCEPCKKLQ